MNFFLFLSNVAAVRWERGTLSSEFSDYGSEYTTTVKHPKPTCRWPLTRAYNDRQTCHRVGLFEVVFYWRWSLNTRAWMIMGQIFSLLEFGNCRDIHVKVNFEQKIRFLPVYEKFRFLAPAINTIILWHLVIRFALHWSVKWWLRKD